MTIHERLRALRTEAKLSQRQCAEQLGAELHNYNKWENGVTPPLEMICRIAKHYAVTTDYLLGLEDVRTHDNSSLIELLNDREARLCRYREQLCRIHMEIGDVLNANQT